MSTTAKTEKPKRGRGRPPKVPGEKVKTQRGKKSAASEPAELPRQDGVIDIYFGGELVINCAGCKSALKTHAMAIGFKDEKSILKRIEADPCAECINRQVAAVKGML